MNDELPTEADMLLECRALRLGWDLGRRKRGRIKTNADRVLAHPEATEALKARAQEVLRLLTRPHQPHDGRPKGGRA